MLNTENSTLVNENVSGRAREFLSQNSYFCFSNLQFKIGHLIEISNSNKTVFQVSVLILNYLMFIDPQPMVLWRRDDGRMPVGR